MNHYFIRNNAWFYDSSWLLRDASSMSTGTNNNKFANLDRDLVATSGEKMVPLSSRARRDAYVDSYFGAPCVQNKLALNDVEATTLLLRYAILTLHESAVKSLRRRRRSPTSLPSVVSSRWRQGGRAEVARGHGREDDLACTKSTKLNFAPLAYAIYEPWLYAGRDGGTWGLSSPMAFSGTLTIIRSRPGANSLTRVYRCPGRC